MSNVKRSEKHEAARAGLPKELQPVFDQFVEDYKFAGVVHHGAPFVSYIILAEMVRAGWRLTGTPLGQWVGSRTKEEGTENE
jgi:hypothetical protein